MSERQASTYRNSAFTGHHVRALNILSENHVGYMAEFHLYAFGNFDSKGRAIAYTVDILINDANWGAGVIEIDGEIHMKLRREQADARRDRHLKALGLWVEHILKEDIAQIMQVLEKHRAKIDAYGGRS